MKRSDTVRESVAEGYALKSSSSEQVGSYLSPSNLVVTCALPYADGDIHIGGVTSTYLPADIFVRYQRLLGNNVVFVCASDDYGTPILIAAENQGKKPEEFVSYWNERFQQDFLGLWIKFDIFDQTSSAENQKLTQHFFTKLNEKGFISKREVLESYCPKCLKFLPDRYVKGRCPYCGATEQYSDGCEKCGRVFERHQVLEPHCSICGSKPETKSSEHFIFRLSHFSNQLEKWLRENTNLQPSVKNYVTSWIKEGLRDWDITRDITWGVPIPLAEAKGKVLYGWFDNHICYISATKKYIEREGRDGKKFWNTARIYHFIGKDIVYHHYLFLPAMRLGVGEYALPHFIPTRGHLLLQGEKFSKSRGWGVALRDFLKDFPADYLRFYLTSITPYSETDVNFDWKDFQAKINNELVANIGNFVHRTLTFLWTRFNGKVPEHSEFDDHDREFESEIKDLTEQVGKELGRIESDRALKKILEFSDLCNQYFQRKQPWADKEGAANCLYLCVNAIRSLAILLEPFLPHSTETLWNILGLNGSVHEQNWVSTSLLDINPDHVIRKPEILFRKIEDSEIEKQLAKLKPPPKAE